MRRILFAVIGCFTVFCAHAAQIVNVDYVHKLIAQEWDISVPIKTDNIMAAANMKYLLTAVDVANEILNGEKTTDYGNGEFATLHAADTIATNQAVETLVKKEQKHEFTLTTIPNTNSFDFRIAAAGEFVVDWGDGTVENITKLYDNDSYYSHEYATAGEYTIGLSGQATAYNILCDDFASIRFQSGSEIASIDGSLGAIFGTLTDGSRSQPCFRYTFGNAYNIKTIPANLFAGISGAPASDMFDGTFSGCSGLTSIPSDLFTGISGAPASGMFSGTFYGCSGLTSIPENLFGNISGTAQGRMFYRTFYNCISLTGPSARINGQYLYEIWPDATSGQVGDMYYNATGLDDYRCIPTVWGGGGEDCSATPAEFTLTTTPDTTSFSFKISAAGEFVVDWGDGTVETITKPDTTDTTYTHNYATADEYTIGIGGQATAYNTVTSTAAISFYVNSSQTKIASIDGSLGAIFGTLADGTQPRFYQTFYYATNMTGSIPSDLFAGISGAPTTNMFNSTFYGCSGLTSIPEKLFGDISGTAQDGMFYGTFFKCTSLTGPSARINGQYLYEIWPDASFSNGAGSYVIGPYYQCTGLSDYNQIPNNWKVYVDNTGDF